MRVPGTCAPPPESQTNSIDVLCDFRKMRGHDMRVCVCIWHCGAFLLRSHRVDLRVVCLSVSAIFHTSPTTIALDTQTPHENTPHVLADSANVCACRIFRLQHNCTRFETQPEKEFISLHTPPPPPTHPPTSTKHPAARRHIFAHTRPRTF